MDRCIIQNANSLQMQVRCKNKLFAFFVESVKDGRMSEIERSRNFMLHILEHFFIDSIGLLPFLFLTYLAMELLEHYTGSKLNEKIQNAGKLGPLWGAALGIVPQCGFSAAAASFYSGRIIGIGTLIAVFLSTSDEMLPILLSESVPFKTVLGILGIKLIIACVSGMIAETVYEKFLHKKDAEMDIHAVCEEEQCSCEEGVLKSAIKHTITIYFYILLITFVLNFVIHGVGEEVLGQFLSNVPVLGQLIAALVGLIPNCASSVVITQLYVKGVISSGMMMSGLLVNAGVGTLVLIRLNRNFKQNMGIIGSVYGFGVLWGVVIDLFGIVF